MGVETEKDLRRIPFSILIKNDVYNGWHETYNRTLKILRGKMGEVYRPRDHQAVIDIKLKDGRSFGMRIGEMNWHETDNLSTYLGVWPTDKYGKGIGDAFAIIDNFADGNTCKTIIEGSVGNGTLPYRIEAQELADRLEAALPEDWQKVAKISKRL